MQNHSAPQKTKRSPGFILNLLGIGSAISLLGDATLYTVLPHPDISAQLGITLSMVGLLLGANRAILRAIGRERFDVMWVDKGRTLA